MAKQSTLVSIRSLMSQDLAQLNEIIELALQSSIPSINTINLHITQNQGKRLRSLLAMLAAKAHDYQGSKHITLAAIIELIHIATLLHDDVVDKSTQRRGQITANQKWGNQISVLVGDFLYSRSFQLMAQLNNHSVFDVLANTTNIIAEGEVMQLDYSNQTDLNTKTYFKVIHHKTAKLFESSAQLGATIAQAADNNIQDLAQYGCHFGIAYQLIDDLLDYSGQNKRLGKNTGDDFNQRKVTLPLIYTLASANAKQRQDLHNHITGKTTMSFADGLAIVKQYGALEKVHQHAKDEANKAQNLLQKLPDSPYKEALLDLTNCTLSRNY